MNRFEGPSDEPRYPFLTAAACLFVLVLGYLFSCVASSDGAMPARPDTRLVPTAFPTSAPNEQDLDCWGPDPSVTVTGAPDSYSTPGGVQMPPAGKRAIGHHR